MEVVRIAKNGEVPLGDGTDTLLSSGHWRHVLVMVFKLGVAVVLLESESEPVPWVAPTSQV